MNFLSVCSGIEAASVAWHPLGWRAAAFSEIEPFPSAVLAHHYPTTPNHGDMTRFAEWPDHAIDLLCGGTPCQSFSVAGLRKGLDDPRGNLMLTFGAIAARYRPRWLVWENVPGVLSSNEGRDFGAFLGLLGVLGYGFAYRVLDAQFFGVAQRRRRVFVVGCLGDWRSAAAVLFERHSLSGHPAPRREAREGSAAGTLRSTDGGSDLDHARAQHLIAGTLQASGKAAGSATQQDAESGLLVAHTLTAGGFDASEDGTGRGTPLVPVGVDGFNGALTGGLAATMGTRGSSETASGPQVLVPVAFDTTQITSSANRSNPQPGDPCHTLAKGAHAPAVAIQECNVSRANLKGTGTGIGKPGDPMFTLQAAQPHGVAHAMQVRRLTPRECERLQGFPDDYTAITVRGKPAADGPRYKALGNSWAVPVVRWIGQRIDAARRAA